MAAGWVGARGVGDGAGRRLGSRGAVSAGAGGGCGRWKDEARQQAVNEVCEAGEDHVTEKLREAGQGCGRGLYTG